MRYILILAVILLAGCEGNGELSGFAPSGPPLRFNINSLPSNMQSWIVLAADGWNTTAGRELIVIDPQGEHRVIIAAMPLSCANGDAAACTFQHDGIVTIILSESTQPWAECAFGVGTRQIVGHEFGHALMAWFPDNPADPWHSPQAGDLMQNGAPGCHGPTARDIASIAY